MAAIIKEKSARAKGRIRESIDKIGDEPDRNLHRRTREGQANH
jgi:hypothetical protein